MKAELGTYPKDRQILHEVIPLETPLAIDLHVTHYCNFKCNYCVLSASEEQIKKSGFPLEVMSWDLFERFIDQIKEFKDPIKMITMSGVGEATTHPRIVDMVRELRKSGKVKTIQIVSNGALIDKKMGQELVNAGLSELRISLQGMNEKKYKEIAKVDFDWDKFYENMVYFSKIKGECTLKIKIVDSALDTGDEEKFYKLFGDICDAVAIEHVYDAWAVNQYNLDLKGADESKTRYGDAKRVVGVCPRVFTRLDVLPDGSLTQFCHTKFGHEKNIMDMTLKELWTCKEQNQLRGDMLSGKMMEFEQCRRCTFITNTWHEEDILDGYEEKIMEQMREKGFLVGTTYE